MMEQDSATGLPEIAVASKLPEVDLIPPPRRVHSYVATMEDRIFVVPVSVIWGALAGIMVESVRSAITQQPDITLVEIGAALGLAFGVGEILDPYFRRH